MEDMRRITQQSFPRPKCIVYGTPLPRAFRHQSRKMAMASIREAVLLNETPWPDQVAWMAAELERAACKNAVLYQRRAELRVFHTSIAGRKMYDPGYASTRIRRALELPPSGMVWSCGDCHGLNSRHRLVDR